MKKVLRNPFFVFLLLALCLSSASLRAQVVDPSDQFLKAYMASRQAEELEKQGKFQPALDKFRESGQALDVLQRHHADWQPLVVDFRSKRVRESILRLESRLGLESQPEVVEAPTSDYGIEGPLPSEPGLDEPSVRVPSTPSYPLPGGSGADLLDELRMKMQQLESQLAASRSRERTMQAERLTVMRQLEATQNQLREKNLELDRSRLSEAELRTRLNEAELSLKEAIATSENALVLEEQVKRIEQELLVARADREAADEESEAIAARLANAQSQISGLTTARETAEKQRDEALTELDKAREAQGKLEQLIADNQVLEQKLADADEKIRELSERPTVEAVAEIRSQLQAIQGELAATQEESESFQTTIIELRGQLAEANKALEGERLASTERSAQDAERSAQEAQLIEENKLLRDIMTRELREQARRDQAKKLVLEELTKLEVESTQLMANLDFLAQPVYKLSESELALLKASDLDLAPVDSPPDVSLSIAVPKVESAPAESSDQPPLPEADEAVASTPTVEFDSTPAVPAELEPIAREAREYFNRKEYQQAERLYEQILAKDPENIYALSNLGVARFRAGKLKAAELTFQKAIAINPEDSFNHGTLGIVYYRQGRYDDAINVLTKSIALNPKNAIAHNYLGITASQKGWQEAAEKELQSAVALNPNYADAHFNLAVIYATSEPPSRELAKKHYERAIQLGAERDPTLDTLIQ